MVLTKTDQLLLHDVVAFEDGIGMEHPGLSAEDIARMLQDIVEAIEELRYANGT